jgi:hypothetical protein
MTLWVKTGNTQPEHMDSALHPKADKSGRKAAIIFLQFVP